MEQPTNGQLPLMAMLKKPASVEHAVLESFGADEEAAIVRSIQWAWRSRRVRNMSQARAAELLSMPPSHFCNILAGRKYLPPQKINAFQEIVGNTAVTQTLVYHAARREELMRQHVGELVAEHLAPVQAVGGGRA